MTSPTQTPLRPSPAAAPLVRLSDLPVDDAQAPIESQRAAALLRQLPKPPPLPASALLRIEDGLLQRTTPKATAGLPWLRRLLWGSGALATVTASFFFGWGLHQRTLPARSPLPALAARSADVQKLRLPADSQARLLGPHGDVFDFSGPGLLSLGSAELELTDGRLRVESSAQPIQLRVGARRIRISAGGSAQLQAQLGELVYVAAYRGSVSVEGQTGDDAFQSFAIPAGATWPAPGPGATSALQPEAGPKAAPGSAASSGGRSQPRPARAVAVRPPTMAPPPLAPPPPVSGDASLLAESQLLGQALQRLHREHDPRGALSVLDSYASQFAAGRLRDEAQAARVDALMQLDRRSDALQVLDSATLARLARGSELRLLRGELRAHAGRCREALSDFSATWQIEGSREGDSGQRALYGLATCHLSLGERGLARDALRRYLERYPAGRFSDAARDALGRLP